MALTVEIVTPEKRVASVTCDEVRAPGEQGSFGVRPGHTHFLSALVPGRLTLVKGAEEVHYAVGEGFLQVSEDRVLVLVDSAEAREEIDVARAKKAMGEASERLRKLTEQDENYALEFARLRRAAARLNVAG